jgi:hypothetical protein
MEVRVADGAGGFLTLAEAEGATKKLAQQEAARRAFDGLVSGALLPPAGTGGLATAKSSAAVAEEVAS